MIQVVDSHVMRFPAAVSWFSPGSYEKRPTLETPLKNLVCAGGKSWTSGAKYVVNDEMMGAGVKGDYLQIIYVAQVVDKNSNMHRWPLVVFRKFTVVSWGTLCLVSLVVNGSYQVALSDLRGWAKHDFEALIPFHPFGSAWDAPHRSWKSTPTSWTNISQWLHSQSMIITLW